MSMPMPSVRLRRKRFLLVARYYSIEPLGILYLAGLIEKEGWECEVLLVHEFDFGPLYERVQEWTPDLVGFQIWTGYHTQAFAACDAVRSMGVPVVIGGPHATYFHQECALHADWVVRGMGFNLLASLLSGDVPKGVHFDQKGREDPFPLPNRAVVYDRYPALGRSPIKSMFASVGCPFKCTYCYAPAFNTLHGGFKLISAQIDRLIIEALELKRRWPLDMVYFQDDIFGFDYKYWLPEFAKRWRQEVGVPFHCQVRLELVEGPAGDRRLDLFAEAGCTGITLAIESGNSFLREQVLFRGMSDELILEGCRKILDRGMTLRTEQILAVPFSDTATDLSTLDLNSRINPTMAWTSILAPYQGTNMGKIAHKFGLYLGNNDDLAETFFDRSVLRHVEGGPGEIGRIVHTHAPQPQVLLKLDTRLSGRSVEVGFGGKAVGAVELLDDAANDRYCEDTVRLQRLFNFLAKVPGAQTLGRALVDLPSHEWHWERIGKVTNTHLRRTVPSEELDRRTEHLRREMGVSALPLPIAQNPQYFCYFPAGGILANRALEQQVFDAPTASMLDDLNTLTRRHLFHYGLYKLEPAKEPIAV